MLERESMTPKTKALYRFDREDIIDAVRDVAKKDPAVFECDCGCDAIVAYAMGTAPADSTQPVLWLLSQLSSSPSITVTGFESIRETRAFLEKLERRHAADKLRPLLLDAWLGAFSA